MAALVVDGTTPPSLPRSWGEALANHSQKAEHSLGVSCWEGRAKPP